MASYCVRLFSSNPLDTLSLANGSPQLMDVYGPQRSLVGWLASFTYGASDFSEQQTASFTAPNGQNQITSTAALDFRCGNWGAPDADVVFVGLIDVSNQGADRGGRAAQAIPLSVVAVPGGRKRVPGTARFTIASGTLTFQL